MKAEVIFNETQSNNEANSEYWKTKAIYIQKEGVLILKSSIDVYINGFSKNHYYFAIQTHDNRESAIRATIKHADQMLSLMNKPNIREIITEMINYWKIWDSSFSRYSQEERENAHTKSGILSKQLERLIKVEMESL